MPSVFILIHDKEPHRAGYKHPQMVPARLNTEILGVFSTYEDAARAARKYVKRQFGVSKAALEEEGVVWDDGGWLGEADELWQGDDRVHVHRRA